MSNTENYDIYKKGYRTRGVYTEKQAEDLFRKILDEKGLTDEFQQRFSTSDQSLVLELAKAFSVTMTHTIDSKRDSLWLETTDDLQQAYNIVRFYDYSIVRKKAPTINLRYKGSDTLILHRGDVIGKYNNLDVVCMQDLMYLEYGDTKNFVLGKWKTATIDLKEDTSGDLGLIVNPTTLSSVDNNHIFIQKLGEDDYLPATKHIEAFITNKAYRDFSFDINSTELYLANRDRKLGLYEDFEDSRTVKISYIETDGVIDSDTAKNISSNDIQFIETFNGNVDAVKIDYYGYNGDTVKTLQRHAVLTSTTGGKAQSLRDYKGLMNAIPEIYSCNPFKDKGVGVRKKYTIIDETKIAKCTIDVTDFEIKSGEKNLRRFAERVMLKIPPYRVEVLNDNEFTIQTEHNRMAYVVNTLENLTEVVDKKAVDPICCTLMVPYIKQSFIDGIDSSVTFTEGEQSEVSKSVESFKGWRTEPRFYPATRYDINLELEITLNKEVSDKTSFEQKVGKVLEHYNYKINSKVKIQEIVTKISQIEEEVDYDIDIELVDSCYLVNDLHRYYFMQVDEYPYITVNITYED